MARPRHHRPSLPAQATALLGISLVLALSVAAASPELHEWLHGHTPVAASALHGDASPANHPQNLEDDDGCVVTLFAQGVVLSLAIVALAFMGQAPCLAVFDLFDRIIPEAPGYVHLPSQAPLAALS